MKRLGLLIGLLVAGVFALELGLAALRSRDLQIAVTVTGSAVPVEAIPTPDPKITPTPQPSGQAPRAASLFMNNDGALVVNINWNYRIGPSFPNTIVRAEVLDSQTQMILASNTYTIVCPRSDTLSCVGNASFEVLFGVRDGEGQRAPYPRGSYEVKVSRNYGGLAVSTLSTRELVVLN
jgi:hypothetical protein